MERQRQHTGFTLMEVMITVAIVGILASVAIPNYQRAIERGYWREAQDVLRTIYAGEQVYLTVNNNTYLGGLDNLSALAQWRQIYTDNPNLGSIPVAFSVTANNVPPPPTFLATAERGDGRCMSIDDQNTLAFTSTKGGCTMAWNQP